MDSLSTVIASIFLWISSHLHVISADFKQPPNYPEIRFINQEKLSDMACSAHEMGCGVRANVAGCVGN